MSLKENFIQNLKEVLGERSGYWLSKQTGISQAAISRLFSGQHAPSLATIERLANTLGVNPHELIKEPKFKTNETLAVPHDLLRLLEDQDNQVYDAIRAILRALSPRQKPQSQ